MGVGRVGVDDTTGKTVLLNAILTPISFTTPSLYPPHSTFHSSQYHKLQKDLFFKKVISNKIQKCQINFN
jgi:hypothetical protein